MTRDNTRRATHHLIQAYALLHGAEVDEERLEAMLDNNPNSFVIDLATSEVGSVLRIFGIEPSLFLRGHDVDLVREVSRF